MPGAIKIPDVEFPEKFQALFQPFRYVILYGGRGGAKSWGVARYLLLEGAKHPLTILCARELQNSIKDSVHKLLAQQIEKLGLGSFYEIQQNLIRGANGTEFNFEGIRHNIGKIKSYEGVDFCWVEEAQSTSENSWEVLIPTIRKPGSRIIATFNPDLETDATYQRFVVHTPPNCALVFVSWRDNPWFNETELPAERDALKARNYDSYLHVWEGQCKQNLEGSVYADEMRDASVHGRLCKVPYDRSVSVDTSWDLGRSDHTSIWFVQRVGFELHFIDFYQERLKHIDHYLQVLQNRGYTLGTIWLPHDARAKQLGSKMTIEEQVRAKFKQVRIVPRVSIKDKINAARTIFPISYFDQDKCKEGLHALRHYRFEVDQQTKQFSQHPLHDEHSDAASAFEYFGLASKMPNRRGLLGLASGLLRGDDDAYAIGLRPGVSPPPFLGESQMPNSNWLK
jgi:phage terminase large subunit